jgi:hypothetical protein
VSSMTTVSAPVPAGSGTADRITVLDPTADIEGGIDNPGPDAGSLAGRSIGFRVDVLWPSWDWVVDEWTKELAANGAAVHTFRRVQGLSGDEGSEADVEYQQFLSDISVAIVGLGNCGSCTSWTVKDATQAANAGLPTVAVVTEQFTSLAGTLARHYGRPGLRTFSLPFPLQTRPEQEVRTIARDAFPSLLALMGATR